MNITKQKSHEIDFAEFEATILSQLVPSHIPAVQWKDYLEGKRDRKEKEKDTNQYR